MEEFAKATRRLELAQGVQERATRLWLQWEETTPLGHRWHEEEEGELGGGAGSGAVPGGSGRLQAPRAGRKLSQPKLAERLRTQVGF